MCVSVRAELTLCAVIHHVFRNRQQFLPVMALSDGIFHFAERGNLDDESRRSVRPCKHREKKMSRKLLAFLAKKPDLIGGFGCLRC
jgi:hypothetical protein